jgi:hypothetical protein
MQVVAPPAPGAPERIALDARRRVASAQPRRPPLPWSACASRGSCTVPPRPALDPMPQESHFATRHRRSGSRRAPPALRTDRPCAPPCQVGSTSSSLVCFEVTAPPCACLIGYIRPRRTSSRVSPPSRPLLLPPSLSSRQHLLPRSLNYSSSSPRTP